MPKLPNGIKFYKAKYPKKYLAVMPSGKRVSFGHQGYQQYKDTVPKNLGGGKWSHKNHLDKERRRKYRKRHSAQGYHKRLYSPAWFSYYFLW